MKLPTLRQLRQRLRLNQNKFRRQSWQRTWGFEPLEQRALLAAVTSVQSSGLGITAGIGRLNADDVATLTVNFDAPVVVTRTNGSPTLTLNTGAKAYYTGGSGTTALAFQYIVGARHNTNDLTVTAMTTNGSTIQTSGVNATLTGAVTNPAGTLGIDTVAPTATITRVGATSQTAGTPLQFNVVFSEPVSGLSTSSFTLTTSGVTGATVASVVQGTDAANYTVTVNSGGAGTVGLNIVGATIKDLAGNGFGGGSFGTLSSFTTGSAPASVAVADFNSDGKPDWAVANQSTNNISVMLGDGNGGIASTSNVSIGGSPYYIATVDLNADGKQDLITLNQQSSSISVLLSSAAGTFSSSTTTTGIIQPNSLAIADFNLDGKLDVIIASFASVVPVLLLGNGTGGFGSPINVLTPSGTRYLVADDVNNDGKPDLLTTSFNNNVFNVQAGAGGTTFGTASNFTIASTPTNILLSDFNNDQKLDVAALTEFGGRVALGTGTGSFGNAISFTVPSNAIDFAARDLTGDNNVDVATVSGNAFNYANGLGTGSFGTNTAISFSTLSSMELADVNSDGRWDAIVSNSFANNVTMIVNGARAQTGPVFTITNAAPTDLALSNLTAREEQSTGLVVGTFIPTDADANDNFQYTLVSGTDSTDNASFKIAGNQLQTNAIFDFETKSSMKVRVRATDSGGLFVERAFTIQVLDEFESDSPTLVQQIAPANTLSSTNGAQFGKPIAISSDYYLVGAPLVNAGAISSPGQAFLYSAQTGQLLRTFNNPSPGNVDQMGSSVALSGNTVVLGAYFDSVGAVMAGRAMIFNAATGSPVAVLDNPTPASNDQFGAAVAAGGGLIAVGAPADDGNATNSGAVHIYSATGAFQRTILNPPSSAGAFFGQALAMEASTLVVTSSDALYVYRASDGVLLRTISNPTGSRTDSFGVSVALSGSRVAVSATNGLAGAIRSGNVRVYDINTGALLQTYTPPTATVGDSFGASISMDSQSLAIGAPGTDIGGVSNVGAAYLYNVTNGQLRGGMSNPTPNADDQFGAAVATLGVKTVVGAPLDDGAASNQGNLFVFSRVTAFGVGLSANTINENNAVGATIGNLTATAGATSPVSYALVSGTGGTDNASFTIVGSQLRASQAFNYESKSSYSALIEATDAVGMKSRLIAVVNVANVNELPTNIAISNASVAEMQSPGVLIGTLSTTDPDGDLNFNYTLTTGAYADNANFQIVGNQLQTKLALDYESRNQYQIEVRSQDAGGLATTKVLTIDVDNVNQPADIAKPRYDLRIVADLNSTIQSSDPKFAVEMNGYTYFSAKSLVYGRELYRVNAITGVAEMVADLAWDTGDANPQSLTVMGNRLYFTANYSYVDPNAPPGGLPQTLFGIWKSDGTAAGTTLVKEIQSFVSPTANPKPGFVVGNRVLLFVGDESMGEELWSTDGTSVGTTLLQAFPSAMGPISSSNFPAVVAGGKLFFNRAIDTSYGNHSLWRSDGTAFGTFELQQVTNFMPPDFGATFDPSLTAIGSTVYFVSNDGFSGLELWKSDGETTVRVADINPMSGSAPTGMIEFQNSLYFSANDGQNNRELWKSNGTTTSMVANISTSLFGDGLSAQFEKFTVFGGQLYFVADDGTGNGLQLYRTNGTGAGTAAFTSDGTAVFNPDRLVALPDRLLIFNSYGPLANQLWSTDGSQASNQMLTSFNSIGSVATDGSQAFLALNKSNLGTELWVSNGLATGTQLLSDIRTGTQSGLTSIIATSQGRAILAVNDGVRGDELGMSDGTVVGTKVIDIARGTPASNVTQVVPLGNAIYIATLQGLYVSQTDTGVTTLLTSNAVSELTAVGSKMFFVSGDSSASSNKELWVSDGTAVGTKRVYDIRTGTVGSNPAQLISFEGLVYFVANDGVNGKELWRSGGAVNDPLNTTLHYQFGASSADGNIEKLAVVGNDLYVLANGQLYIRNSNNTFNLLAANARGLMPWNGIVYFSSYTSNTGDELWRTDGTVVGTYMVKDIVPGPASSYPGGGVVANEDPSASLRATTESRLVFRAFDANGAGQLFATNGTTAGTVALTNAPYVDAGFGLVPINLTTVGNQVYFQGYSQAAGLELWTTDGTQDGTRLVADLRPGGDPNPLNNDPGNPVSFNNLTEMTALRDKLFFSADSTAAGRELWVSDGSVNGSYMAADIREGTASGLPKRLFVMGNSLYLAADSDDYGIGTIGSGELFRLNESPYLADQSGVVAAGSSIQFRLDGLDNDGDALTYQVVNSPMHGVLVINGNIATYTPAVGFTGTDAIGIVARDSSLSSDTAIFGVAVRSTVPSLSFVSASSTISEADQVFVANVTLSAPATENLILPFTYGFGDAELQNFVSFAPGQQLSQIVIPFSNNNSFQQSTQLLEVTLKSNPDVAIGSVSQHVATILDDEAFPKIFFVDSTRTYSEVDGTVNVEVGLTSASESIVTATISLNSLLGSVANDFTYAPQTQIVFLPGQLRQSVVVRIINDQLPESREGLLAGIAAVSGATIIGDPNRFRSLIWVADDDASVINLSPANTLVTEGDTLTLIATRTGGTLSTPLDVSFSTFFGGTTAADYSVSSSVFHFAAGASQATITFTAVDDSVVDAFEQITFELTSSPSYVIGDQSTAYVGIYDNDIATVTFDYAPEEKTIFDTTVKNYWERTLSNRQIRFVAKLSSPSDTTISIPVVVSDGTQTGYAKQGLDYSFSTANVIFAPGVTEVSRTLEILNDDVPEGIEKLTIALAPAANQSSLRIQGPLSDFGLSKTLTITDDDYSVSVRALNPADGKVKESFVENAGTINFEVSLGRAPDEDVRLDLELTSNMLRSEFTAAGFDASLQRTVVLRDGVQSVIVPIVLHDDSLFEKAPEKLTFKASRSNRFYFDATDSQTVTITDNEKPPTLRFSSGNSLRLSDNSDSIIVGLDLEGGISQNTSVKVAFGGSAIRGQDYEVAGGSATGFIAITTSDLSLGIEIVPKDNHVLDGDKTIDITVYSPNSLILSLPPEGIKTTATIVETKPQPTTCAENVVSSAPYTVNIATGDTCIGPLPDVSNLEPFNFIQTSNANSVIPDKIAIYSNQQGIIEGATLFFDANFNGVRDFLDINGNGRQDANEPNEPTATSDLGGAIALTIPSGFDRNRDGIINYTEGRMASSGGTDTATGLPWNMLMSSPAGVFAVTPLTTALETLLRRHSLSKDAATEIVQTAFGLQSFNIAGGNTIYDVLSNDATAALAYSRQVAISSASILTASLFSGQSGESLQQFEQAWMDLLADVLRNQTSVVDLSSPALIKQMLTAINRNQAIPFTQSIIDGTATLISLGINRAQSIRLEQFAQPIQFLEAITRIKKLMHGALANDLIQVGAGTQSIGTALSTYTGASAPNFDSLAAAQTIGQIIPPVLLVNNVNIQEGSGGTRTLEFQVDLQGDHVGTVTTNFATVDGTAKSANGDYVPVSGSLTWLPGDNSSRLVSVNVSSDAQFELDEFFSLIVSNATNAVIRRGQGYGGILNDDALSLANTTGPGNMGVVYADDISFVRNNELFDRGQLLQPTSAMMTGAANDPTEFSIDFFNAQSRADQFTLMGGTAVDPLTVSAGRFDSLLHVINPSQSGWSALRFEDGTASQINWTSIDSFSYLVSTLGEMVIQVPSSVSSLVIDDPDPTVPGVMRVSSSGNEFAPIYFTTPAAKLTIVKLNPATSVITQVIDAAFTGSIQELFGGVTPTANEVMENQPSGLVVGTFETVNPIIVGDYHVTLVAGAGDSDNSKFIIAPDGKTLQTAATFDYETSGPLSIRTKTTGPYDIEFESVFSVLVVNQNEQPVDLELLSSRIAENSAIGTAIGSLQATDPDSRDTFTYSFASGGAPNDNAAFTLDTAGVVRSNTPLNFENKSAYTIRVLATDQGGLAVEKTLSIQVDNMLEISQPIQIGDGTSQRSVVKQLVVTFDQSVVVDPGAFLVQQRARTAGGALQLNTVTTSVVLAALAGGGTRATLTFSGAYTRAGTNGLVDGNYQLTINGSMVRSQSSNAGLDADNDGVAGGQRTMGAIPEDYFFALLGDTNGNGEVDPQDLLGANNAFRSRLGQANYNAAYDINGNGQIDSQDLLAIQNNFRRRRVFF